ncbi:MAG: M14 family metallopeptidase [Longimicrobiales bacterium]
MSPRHARPARAWSVVFFAAIAAASPARAQDLTTPEAFFGHAIGADYHLPNYTKFEAYWRILDRESPRMVVQEIGRTAEGRAQLMVIVTSPENHARLARYKEISQLLALAEGVSEQDARALAREGKAVVWIDGGLHGSEVLGAQQLMETIWQMVSGTDEETLRFLDDVITLFVHANPDGQEIVSDWYMREADPLKRTTGGIPRLYHKYVGHDNNRDSYMAAMPETESMSRQLYIEWMPQIMYNHHQVGPGGAVMFAPPFRYPANYNIEPLVLAGIEQVGMAMQARFLFEDKPGVTMKEGGPFSTWWNGGLRTTTYFHNQIGILTETQGNPTPIEMQFVPSRILPDGDYFMPIPPQPWHFRQSVDYEVTANKAILDHASRNREQLLLNMWRAARNQIEKGSTDSWTNTPTRVARLYEVLEREGNPERFLGSQTGALAGYFSSGVPARYFQSELRKPEDRDPRGYILPSDQKDFPTATKFVNALIKTGVTVHRASSPFEIGGKRYPANSWVVKTAQAYRPHVLDMFEPQDHPNDLKYEGGPPVPPYDNAGYTLAFQMGVEFDRILEGFDGPFERVAGLQRPPAGAVSGAQGAAGFLLSHAQNDVAIVTNRLLAEGVQVNWLKEPIAVSGTTYPAGTVYVPAASGVVEKLSQWAAELGVDVHGVPSAPRVPVLELNPIRVGLWDQYGGSMPSGWTRWLFEQFEFPFEVVYPKTLDGGDLRKQYDVLVFVTDAIPAADRENDGFEIFGDAPTNIPEQYQAWLGSVTVKETVPQLLRFLEEGGTIIAVGSSVAMATHAGLPMTDHLVDGEGRPVGEGDYYVPGSVLRVRVDTNRPIAWGLGEELDVFFSNSPVFRLQPAAVGMGVKPVAWFDSPAPLRSGWAWGQHRLQGGVAMAEAKVGNGNLFLFGPGIAQRGQPHGTFKLLFNGIFLAGATEGRPIS